MKQTTDTGLSNCNFFKLPAELILTIFHTISSPQDLYALIQVSSITHKIFATHKLTILTNVVRQAFHPDVLPLAVLLSYIYGDIDAQKILSKEMQNSPFAPSGWHSSESGNLDEFPLFEKYINLRQELIDLKHKGGDVMSSGWPGKIRLLENEGRGGGPELLMLSNLCRVCDIVDAFISKYSMAILNNSYWTGKPKTQDLSKYERGRFQRATLNCMTFDCLNRDIKLRIPWRHFFSEILNDSECRELNSLYYHITDWILNCFNNIKRYAEEQNRSEGGGCEVRNATFSITGMRVHSSVRGASLNKLRLFLKEGNIGQCQVPFIIDRGIPFCTRFFDMTMEEQIDTALPLLRIPETCTSGHQALF